MGQVVRLAFFNPQVPAPDKDTELSRAGDNFLIGVVVEWCATQRQLMARGGTALEPSRRADLMEAVRVLRGEEPPL